MKDSATDGVQRVPTTRELVEKSATGWRAVHRLRQAVQRRLYDTWSFPTADCTEGYTLLLLVPGDLPVFLKIAADVCARQDPKGLVETLVIPDFLPTGFMQVWEAVRDQWPHGRIRLALIPGREALVLRLLANPHANCFQQFVTGINATGSTHAIWHDADLFFLDAMYLRRQFETCRENGLACLGSTCTWDDWYAKRDIHHVVATWEMVMDVGWVREFRPWEHRGHKDVFRGCEHIFDITHFPQCQTDPHRVGVRGGSESWVHFNYTISSYRWFQRARTGFEDDRFRLLLIRLLVDSPDPSGGMRHHLPSLDSFVKGLTDAAAPVTYSRPQTAANYAEFRRDLDRILSARVLGEQPSDQVAERIRPFDRAFGWNGK